MDVKELIRERVQLVEQNRALVDAVGQRKAGEQKLTGEEQGQYDARSARVNEIRGLLDREAETSSEERALGESRGRQTDAGGGSGEGVDQPTPQERDLAFRAWCMGRNATPSMQAAALRCGVNIHASYIDMGVQTSMRDGKEVRTYVPVQTDSAQNIERRALSVGTTTAGGNSVPNETVRAYLEVQKWFGQVVEMSTVINTETGATLPYPVVTDTANSGAALAEATAATTNVDPTFSVVNLGAWKFSSKAVLISWELLQDSYIDLATFMGTMLGRRVGRIKNNKYTVGAGTTEPQGLITGSTTSAAAATNAFTPDEIITLIHALDPAYRSLPGTCFQLHDTVISYVRKMKDGQGRYLWEPSLQMGQPDRLWGYPVYANNDMDSAITTGKKLVQFGNMKSAFAIRSAGAVRFVRDDSIYVQQHQVYFEAIERGDSAVIDATASKVLTLA